MVCAQNGVDNERIALRRFDRVYGMCVWLPAAAPGAGHRRGRHGHPYSGMLHVGRYPPGCGRDLPEQIVADLDKQRLRGPVPPDVMRWKYGKLLGNLGNAVEALVGHGGPARRRAAPTGPAPRAGRCSTRPASPTPRPRKSAELRGRQGGRPCRSTASSAAADRPGRAWPGAPARSRPTTSTARSSCSAASTACPPRSTRCCSARPTGSRARELPPGSMPAGDAARAHRRAFRSRIPLNASVLAVTSSQNGQRLSSTRSWIPASSCSSSRSLHRLRRAERPHRHAARRRACSNSPIGAKCSAGSRYAYSRTP